jgi:hypothetical protein
MAYTKYSLTPANNNAAPPDGAPEGMLPSAVNDTMRDMMAQIRDVGDGIRGGTYTMTAPVITGGSITGVALSGNTLTNPVITGGSINNTPIGASTAAAGTFTSLSDSGNLTFTGTGNRILGDFSNATFANRVAFQTSTTNGNSNLSLLPNGTATFTSIVAFNNSDPTNAGLIDISASTTQARLRAGITGTGTYLPLTFATNNAEVMRIDTSGNVGIGTSSPSTKLQVAGDTKIGVTGTNGVLQLARSSDGATITNFQTDGTSGIINSAVSTTFQINTAEAMRIDSSGNFFVGGTTQRNGTRATIEQAGNLLGLSCSSNTNAVDFAIFYANAGTICGSISRVGTTSAVVYGVTSDYRLKENVQPFVNALDSVSKLKPCKYTWKDGGASANGFIAHELQEVCPDAVVGTKDAVDEDGNPKYQAIDQAKIVALLTAAIQEQQALIENLTTRLNALEGK